MADNKQEFQWLEIPDGEGGYERKWCKDAEARAAIEILDPASVEGKADKVTGATSGHLAGLDSNGNLTDSGKSPGDFASSDIEDVIPTQASATNQLADKDFVNSSVSTSTAEYRGNYNSVTDLSLTVEATHAEIAAALDTVITTADNNDYSFVQIPTSDDTPTEIEVVERYKHDGTQWAFEYALNNSGFTAAQWAALNSDITSGLVTKLTALPTNAELTTLLNGKYVKPDGGIPSSDMASAVQTSLGKADTALQSHQTVVLASGTNNGTMKLTVGGTETDNVAVTGLGTAAYKGVANEVNTSTNLVQAGSVKTYVDDRIFIPVDQDALTPSSTFVKRSVLGINGVLYYATADTDNFPLPLVVHNGNFVTYDVNGKSNYAVTSNTINSGWAMLADVSMDEYRMSQKQDRLTFDTTPKSGSANPVTSNGVKAAIDSAVSDVNTTINSVCTKTKVIGTADVGSKISGWVELDPDVDLHIWPVATSEGVNLNISDTLTEWRVFKVAINTQYTGSIVLRISGKYNYYFSNDITINSGSGWYYCEIISNGREYLSIKDWEYTVHRPS